MPFHRILCPVDFSGYSRRAVETALELASSLGASLTLLHVVEPTHELFPPPAGLLPARAPGDDLHADARRELESWSQEIRAHRADVPVSLATGDGSPSAAILDAVTSGAGHDLVVMGSHGRGGLERAILGSVADHVVRHASCPVLVVPPPAS